MTYPEGRRVLQGHPSTWPQEVEQLRVENERLRTIATKAVNEWESWVRDQLEGTSTYYGAISEVRKARAALQKQEGVTAPQSATHSAKSDPGKGSGTGNTLEAIRGQDSEALHARQQAQGKAHQRQA